MNQDRSRLGSIHNDLDAAFATVQEARSRRELGDEGAQNLARRCVASAAARINQQLLKTPLSEADNRLVQAKLKALIGAAARIPGPSAGSPHDEQPTKAPRAAKYAKSARE